MLAVVSSFRFLTLAMWCVVFTHFGESSKANSDMRAFMDGIGALVSCNNEGEPISTSHIRDTQCYHCICQNHTAVCTQEKCPSLSTCPLVERNQSSVCCKKCKSCTYLGQTYQNDEQWWSGQDSCRTLTCKAGVITQSRVQCITKCSNPQRMVGYCCPVCPSSSDYFKTSLSVGTKNDPCLQCHCDTKLCHCFRAACPALDCQTDEQYTPVGSCCPECKPRESRTVPDGCIYQNVAYLNEQSFRPDPCTLCKCQDSTVICRRFLCPLLNCPKRRLYFEKNLCCPRCRDKDPLSCKYESQEYKHGDVWQLDACSKCVCANGESICTTMQCRFAKDRCPKGYKWLEPVKGQCCGVCEEKESTCTVFGDPHYQTFDGRTYNFQGTCRYVLAKTCSIDKSIRFNEKTKSLKRATNEFSIIVQNEPRGQEQYTWTRHVSLRLTGGKRVALLPGKRVRLNRKPLKLPHVDIGVFSVMIDNQGNVILRVVDGPKIVWDGNSYVEVTVSSNYRKSLCGLCGNYNGDPEDDFQMHTADVQNNNNNDVIDQQTYSQNSKAVITKNINAFGQSWRLGSWKACKSHKDRTYHQQIDEQKRKIRRKQNTKKFSSNSSSSSLLNINPKFNLDRQMVNSLLNKNDNDDGNNDNAKNDDEKNDKIRVSNSETNSIAEFVRRVDYRRLDGGQKVGRKKSLAREKHRNGDDEPKSENSKPKRPNRKRRRLKRLCPAKKLEKRRSAMDHCELLKSDPFESCHSAVNVRHYYKSCVMDTCACPPTGRCYCEAMLAYSRKCEKENILIEWRKRTNCDSDSPKCPMENGVFSLCALPCATKTCSNVNQSDFGEDCSTDSCVPGCQCPNGTVLHANKCILSRDCPIVGN